MKRILLVDDDHIITRIYQNKLQIEGYLVETAADGETALRLLHANLPDLVVLDLQLPKIGGIEVLKTIRLKPLTQKVPVLVFTNSFMGNVIQNAWQAGATACLTKAECSPKQLLEVIRTTLRAPALTPGTPAPASALRSSSASPGEAAARTLNAMAFSATAESEQGLRDAFLQSGESVIADLRTLFHDFVKVDDEVKKLSRLNEMHKVVRSLVAKAAIVGSYRIGLIGSALEALLKELFDKPQRINNSTCRTVAHALDCLAALFKREREAPAETYRVPLILVVDDERISRTALCMALQKANLKVISLSDPQVASKVVVENSFDLILLDVGMPVMDGFELCRMIRALPHLNSVPIVFATGSTDFETRVQSNLTGGNDFIAKPYLQAEVAVKALTHVFRGKPKAETRPAP